jgi:hypothetical protein
METDDRKQPLQRQQVTLVLVPRLPTARRSCGDRSMGVVPATEKVAVQPLKLSDLVAMVFAYSIEHVGVPRESFIKHLKHLLKCALVFVA